jgi:hypothetical protein
VTEDGDRDVKLGELVASHRAEARVLHRAKTEKQ